MRRRLVLAIAGVAAAAVVLFAVPLAIELRSDYRDEELVRLQRDTVAATRQIDVTSAPDDPIELPRDSDRLAVYDRTGHRLTGSGPPAGDTLVRAALRTGKPAESASGGALVVAVPLVTRERVSGAVRASRDDAGVQARTRRAWLALAALAAGLVAAAALAAVLLARRLAAPLERLAGDARRLGDGDFTARAHRGGVPEVDGVAAALDATAQRLDDLLARERGFSTDASHQLRTPIAALRIELEAMQLDGRGGAELDAALGQVDRLQATVETLLAVARDAPRRGVQTDLAVLTDDVESRWRGTLAADARPLHVSVDTTPTVAAAAPTVVAEILEVLVTNAHRHGDGAVTITVRDVDGWLAVDVRDEGAGFDAEPARAFGTRTPTAAGHGIGLGLATALAQAEGARLTLSDDGPRPVVTLVLRRA
jgi:signal transduction histidine kinase